MPVQLKRRVPPAELPKALQSVPMRKGGKWRDAAHRSQVYGQILWALKHSRASINEIAYAAVVSPWLVKQIQRLAGIQTAAELRTKRVEKLLRGGRSPARVAKKSGYTLEGVRARRKRLGLPMKTQHRRKLDAVGRRAIIDDLYHLRGTMPALARKYGLNRSAVLLWKAHAEKMAFTMGKYEVWARIVWNVDRVSRAMFPDDRTFRRYKRGTPAVRKALKEFLLLEDAWAVTPWARREPLRDKILRAESQLHGLRIPVPQSTSSSWS